MSERDRSTARQTDPADEAQGTDLRAEHLEGETVYDRHESSIGKVTDVVVGEDGRIEVVVIDVGGFLGLATHSVGIGLDRLNIRRGAGDEMRIYLDMSDEELRDLPAERQVPPAAAGFRNR